MHLRRFAFGTLFIALFVLSLLIVERQLFWFVPLTILLATLAGTNEYYRLCRAKGLHYFQPVGLAAAAALLADAYFGTLQNVLFIIILSMAFLFLVQIFRYSISDAISRAATTMFGTLYVALPMALALFCLRHYQHGSYLVFFIVALGWTADTGAYAVGSCWGRMPLAPRLSPKKTVEGAVAGLISTVVIAVLLKLILPVQSAIFSFAEIIGLAIVMSVVGQVGDLAESALKRDAGVKDAGDIGTGHGGVLDIVDSLLLCFPTLFLYVEVLRPDLHLPQ